MQNKEIERKFLVGDGFDPSLASGIYSIKQGYMFNNEDGISRIRKQNDDYIVCFKSPVKGITCDEIEFNTDSSAGEALFDKFCKDVIEKDRFYVDHEGHTWHVDVFKGKLSGLVLAEIELESEDEEFTVPAWCTEEVTGQKQYYNCNLIKV